MGSHHVDPQIQRRMAGHQPEHGQDTGGVPWRGRELTPNPFSGDTGEPDEGLARALRDGVDEETLLRAVASARFFVPVVAAPGDAAEQGTDSVADMATVVLTSPDGERGLPAFTSLATLQTWDPSARPVPVSSQTLAQAAVQESCSVVLLDLGSPTSQVLRSSMVYALAEGRHWAQADRDVVVSEAIARALSAVRTNVGAAASHVQGVHVRGLDPSGALDLVVTITPGLDRSTVHAALVEVGEALASDTDLRLRIDGLRFSVAAGSAPGGQLG